MTTEPTMPGPNNPAVEQWITQAKEDLAHRLSIAENDIALLTFEAKVWPDASYGCPEPDMGYLQVTREGYLIRLRAGKEIYNYHGGEDRAPFLCRQAGPQTTITKQAPLNS